MTRLTASVCLVVLVAGLSGCGQRGTTEPILIGHLSPRSGPEKEVGRQAERGIQLALEEVNQEEQRIIGRQVEVLHVDTEGNLEQVQPAAVRLIAINRVSGLLGGTGLARADRLARTAQSYHMPLVTPAALPGPGSPEVVALGLSLVEEGKALARFAVQDLKVNRAAVIVDSRDAWRTSLTDTFAKEFRKLGGAGAAVQDESFAKDADFAALAQRVAGGAPSVVLIAAGPVDFARLRSELRKSGLPMGAALFWAGEDGSPVPRDEEKDGFALYRATAYVADDKPPSLATFRKAFQERFGQPPDLHAVLAYDSARLLFEAMRQAKSATPARIREELAKIERFDGLTGTVLIDSERAVRRPVFIVALPDGRLVRHWEPE